ncbi:MAG: hypothetical protein CMJ78_22920 [Planctomycetaceae bacterium]|nr:hypothetical protein [Planctomycetaceae bacterium]
MKPHKLSRRGFVQAGLLSVLGANLPLGASRLLADQSKKRSADAVLFLNLMGGPSHYETLDMKPEADAKIKGEFKSIQSNLPGLFVSEYLPKFAKIADKCSLVRGISHSTGDHPQAQQYLGSANRPSPALEFPSVGSVVSRENPTDPALPPFVAIPRTEWHGGYMGDAYAPFNTNASPKKGQPFVVRGITLPEGLTVDHVKRRNQLLRDINTRFQSKSKDNQLLKALDSFGSQADSMLLSPKTRAAFDVSKEAEEFQKLYDDSEFGQGVLLATRLISFGIPFVTVSHAGWDTHLDNFKGHRRLVPQMDSALTSAIAGLEAKGLLERTLVVCMGEFGRTPKVNQNVGRDHYPRVNWSVLAGGGIKPGQIVGATDRNGQNPTDDTDISLDDIGATILKAVGIDHHKEYYTSTGRPVAIVPNGHVIDEVF